MDTPPFKPLRKSIVHKHIWMDRWSPDHPTNKSGWKDFFEVNRHVALDPAQIHENPSAEQGEALKLALWFKPARAAMCNGDGVNDY